MEEDDRVPLSALQHYLYCPRQCALIHVEQLWAENRQTAEGRLLHDRADEFHVESRHGVRTVTAMPLSNGDLGITGKADVVEFHRTEAGEVTYPVEYKRGKPKSHHADEVQLCAQALCLEYMLHCRVEKGALYYGKTRRRTVVLFDEPLRELTKDIIRKTRDLVISGKTPTAEYLPPLCDACSLLDICQPKLLRRGNSVNKWMEIQVME